MMDFLRRIVGNAIEHALVAALVSVFGVGITATLTYLHHSGDGNGEPPQTTSPSQQSPDPPPPTSPPPAPASEACQGAVVPSLASAVGPGGPRLCALVACAGGSHRDSALKIIRWQQLAEQKAGPCDELDRKELTDSAVFNQLHDELAKLKAFVVKGEAMDVCRRIVSNVIDDDLWNTRDKLKNTGSGRCAAEPMAVSSEVKEFRRSLLGR